MSSIGNYQILGEIGHGGMGIVYLARQRGLDRLVALKALNGNEANVPELTKRFARESRLGGSLNHPNIVTVHDYFDEGGTAYIAMEYVPGGSLRSYVGKLSPAQIAGVLEGLLAGLTAVAPARIVHRDLKPENVLVTADGRVKIADFGIAKAHRTVGIASVVTSIGTTVGTPAYMAPEQALSGEIGSWTDLYSVGVIAYEQFVGTVPFHDSRSSTELLLRRVNEPAPSVGEGRPDLAPALSEWVDRLLVKDPTERTRSASVAQEQLEEIVLGLFGPRWRRDAYLSPPSPVASVDEAPASRSVSPPGKPPSQPETESGFYSYGHMPTATDGQLPALSSGSSVEASPVSAEGSPRPLESSGRRTSIPGSGQVNRWRALSIGSRRLLVYALTAVLAVAAGVAIAFLGASTKAPAHNGGLSARLTASRASQTDAKTLSEAMSKLNGVRAKAGAQLDRASTAKVQAAAAERLAHAHEQAADAIRSVALSPSQRTAHTAIVGALTRIASGYATMANAARNEDRRRFDSGRATVNLATSSLRIGLAQLYKRS